MNEARRIKLEKIPSAFCKSCGKKISKKTKWGYCFDCFFKNVPYSDERRKKQSNSMKSKTRWNIHRNQKSFAELFFENVFKNNNIIYDSEYVVKKSDGIHCYLLDFVVTSASGVLYDIEIDGKQHKYRVEEDRIRDEYLKSLGYTVYRIPFNDLKTDKGKQLMKTKVDNLLNILKS